jgi:hypothetical protein
LKFDVLDQETKHPQELDKELQQRYTGLRKMKNERMQANTRLKGTFRHRGVSSLRDDLQDVTVPLHIILGFIVPLPLRRVRRTLGRRSSGTPRSRRSGRLKRSAGIRTTISAQETVVE